MRIRSSCAWVLMAASLMAGCAASTRAPAEPVLTEEQRALNLESFEVAWATIRDAHWDPSYHGMDWPAVRAELRPKVAAASTTRQYLDVMRDMIDRFGQSHFAVVPAKAYRQMMERSAPAAEAGSAQPPAAASGEESQQGAGVTGIDVRVIDGQVLVVTVEPGSPAEQAGVRPGWAIDRIGEIDVSSRLAQVEASFEGKPMLDLVRHATLQNALSGRAGQSLAITFRDGRDRESKLQVSLVREKGRPYRLGIMPAGHIWIESRRLEGDIGYIAFNGFMDPIQLMPAFEKAIVSFMDCRGVVIDIRGNGGGIPLLAMGMAGWLVDSADQYFGTMKTRDAELKFSVNPRVRTYGGPLAVLIDGSSASCAEIFPAGLRDMGRARLFGTTTAGAVLPAQFKELPNGDFFYYPIADYFSKNGARLEGVGVKPDVHAPHTRAALLAGRDNALQAALDWLTQQQFVPPKGTQ